MLALVCVYVCVHSCGLVRMVKQVPVHKLALVTQHIMNACKDNYGTAVLATAPPHSCKKMECFSYKGEWAINA